MTSRHFLLCMWEGGGTVPPEIGLARKLIARGHVVDVLGDPTIEAEARQAGCGFLPWREAPSVKERKPEAALVRDWEHKSVSQTLHEYVETFLCAPAARYGRDTMHALDATGADVVLTDMALFGPSMAAEVRGFPRIGLMPNIYILPVRGIPPMGPGFMPARSPFGKLRDWVMRRIMTRLFNGGTRTLNHCRAELGLPPIAGVIDQFLHVDRMLVLTSKSFDFPTKHLPRHVQYVGPVLDDPIWAPVTWQTPWPRDNSDPIVLVGFSSTFQNQGEVVRRCVEALSSLKVRGIVTLGEQLNVSEFASTRNVVVARSAPHQIILEQAAAIITHCGHGTAMKALHAGVPAVCIPMGRDQNDTAARIVARGAGIRLKTKSSSARIAEAVTSVLNDPKYREGARALASRIRAELAAKDPADALLEGLRSGRDTIRELTP